MNNDLFLTHLFGDQAGEVHVTDFIEDPSQIPASKRLLVWMGNRRKSYKFGEGTNQYFTISIFKDHEGRSRRRKSLFIQTNVIVIDDVFDKIPADRAKMLPEPTYILETSPGSEQWGYLLDKPCTDRNVVENLLSGMVENGLTTDGKDPGMKGVTRYVRLPDGWNTKTSKNNGKPFKCVLKKFNMFRTISIEELAEPFQIDLYRKVYETASEAAEMPDHPIFSTSIKIKQTLSAGRFDITCPWIEDHTGQSDSGTAIFTNNDGTLGFRCHHGHCESKSARDLIDFIELTDPSFGERYSNFVNQHLFASIINAKPETAPVVDGLQELLDAIRVEPLNSPEARRLASEYLRLVDKKPRIDQDFYHNEICDVMHWTKTRFAEIIKDLRSKWYDRTGDRENDFYRDTVYVREQNVLFNTRTRIFFSPESFQNSYSDIDPDARKNALQRGYVRKVDRLDFLPGADQIFEEDGIVFGNSWMDRHLPLGEPGDCSPWLNHFDVIGWTEYKSHLLKWMAFTILKPQIKINHIILLGGLEGIGKDFLMKPLIAAMGHYSKTIPGSFLTLAHNEYMLRAKHLHINETELGDHKKAAEVSANIKPLAASPPDTLQVNPKHLSPIDIRNIVNVSMSTNSRTPIRLTGPSRRLYALWSDLNIRDESGEMYLDWKEYFKAAWNWMNDGGWRFCVHYLRNNVDISDFSPGEAPPMTEFLKDMTEDNRHPAEQTIAAFIEARKGCFGSDIITSDDACDTLRAGLMTAENIMYVEPSFFTPVRFGRIASTMHQCSKGRARKGSTDIRPWIIRNHEKYINLSPTELYDEYEKQIKNFK